MHKNQWFLSAFRCIEAYLHISIFHAPALRSRDVCDVPTSHKRYPAVPPVTPACSPAVRVACVTTIQSKNRRKIKENHWFSMIFNDFHWFSLIFIDFHWFSLIFIDFHRISLISVDFWIALWSHRLLARPEETQEWSDGPRGIVCGSQEHHRRPENAARAREKSKRGGRPQYNEMHLLFMH